MHVFYNHTCILANPSSRVDLVRLQLSVRCSQHTSPLPPWQSLGRQARSRVMHGDALLPPRWTHRPLHDLHEAVHLHNEVRGWLNVGATIPTLGGPCAPKLGAGRRPVVI